MNLPLISIIIPAYNTEKYIEECIRSVINQTYQNWECIVIDDGSQDSTHAIIKNWVDIDRRISLYSQNNQGISKARNSGIDAANGKYIAFLDSDDVWMPHHLEHMLNTIIEQKVDLVYSQPFAIKENVYTSSLLKHHYIKTGKLKGQEAIELFLKHNDISVPSVVCKKETIIKCNKFSYNKKAEDIYAWMTMLINGASFYSSENPTTYVRVREGSLSNEDRNCSKELVEIVHLLKPDLIKLGINFSYYFRLWARRYFLLHNNKKHYIEAINYISSFDKNIFPNFLKEIGSLLPKNILKIIALQKMKLR